MRHFPTRRLCVFYLSVSEIRKRIDQRSVNSAHRMSVGEALSDEEVMFFMFFFVYMSVRSEKK